MSTLAWRCTPFADLSPAELYAALQLRSSVFVVEQRCPFLDPDGDDDRAWHLLGWQHETDHHDQLTTPDHRPYLAAYARLFTPGIKYAEASIGRVVTHPDARRTGAGRALMIEALHTLDNIALNAPIRIGAQRYLERFYASFGFLRDGADYLEDGIVHVEMVRGR